jgi:hypothetical protein
MPWTVEMIREKFGEDVLRDVCRDVNDLMAGKAGHGIAANRIGVPEDLWRRLLRAGGYRESGVEKALRGENLCQADTEGPFAPYTIHSLADLSSERGGPLSPEETDVLLSASLTYRELI